MANRVRVIGDDVVVAALKKLGMDVERALERIVEAAAEPIHEGSQERAPRRSSQLAEEMVEEIVEREPGRLVMGVGPDRMSFYGRFQEFGTAHHAAHPFLRPALAAGEMRAIDAATAEMRKLLIEG